MDIDPLPSSVPGVPLIALLAQAIEFQAPENWVAWSFIIAIACLCLCMSAFVSGSEIAYFGLTPAQIGDLEEEAEESVAAKDAFGMLSNSERLLATILIANNLVNITMVVLLTFAIKQIANFTSAAVEFLVLTVFLTFLLLLCGEIFPKLIAKSRPAKWVLTSAPLLHGVYRLLSPVSGIMVKSSGFINHIVTKKTEAITTDELERALDISDVSEGKDKEMLEGILSFGEKAVSDIMISRVDVTAIESHATWQQAVDIILTSGYSRIPVYDTSQDTIVGVLYSKDLLPYIDRRDEAFQWQKLVREAYFVPESRMIDDLLEDFRRKKIHIAIVINEYGGTMGIVTLEDIIEEIVGDIDDEYDDEEKLYKRLDADTYVFEGKIPLVDFCRIAGIEEEDLGEMGEAETLAGLLLDIKGDFPRVKESLTKGPCKFLVLEIERHRIISVRVHVTRPDKEEEK